MRRIRVIGLAGGGAKHLRDRVGLQPGGHLQIADERLHKLAARRRQEHGQVSHL